jgi:hypothetical protein
MYLLYITMDNEAKLQEIKKYITKVYNKIQSLPEEDDEGEDIHHDIIDQHAIVENIYRGIFKIIDEDKKADHFSY